MFRRLLEMVVVLAAGDDCLLMWDQQLLVNKFPEWDEMLGVSKAFQRTARLVW